MKSLFEEAIVPPYKGIKRHLNFHLRQNPERINDKIFHKIKVAGNCMSIYRWCLVG